MQHKNNPYLKIVILLALLMQTASATMDYFLTYYIPIDSEMDINSRDDDGIVLYKAISYTYYSEPESAISSITQKYIINTPHKEKESAYMRNYNINLAYIKGLKVDLFDYGSKECRVVMDSSKIVSDYSPKVLAKILKYVKKATKLNMKEHKINCAFQEIKAPIVVTPLTVPTSLMLENIAFRTFSTYASGIKEAPFLFDTFYPLGYSKDKIAYAIEYDTDPRDMVHIEAIIQDLLTDKVLWRHTFKREENITNINFNSFWKASSKKILKKLSCYKMHYSNQLQIYQEKLYYNHDALFLTSKNKKSYQKNWGMAFLDSSTIYLRSEKKGKKILNQKYYKGEHILARKVIGYIPLGERGSRRVAVVVANVQRGWEGPPHNLSYDIVGASLRVGFKH